MDIGSLTGEISLEDTLSTALDVAGEKVKEFAELFEGMIGESIAGSALLVTAIAGVGATVFGLAEHAGKAGEEVEDFSVKTGIAVQNIGPLKFAVDAAGGSLDQMNSLLMRMTMKEASDGAGKFSGALKDLGINASDFSKMDSEQKILALGQGFRDGAIAGTKMSDAIALMGRGGANMIPVLEKLTPELMAIAQQSAIIWTPESVAAAEEFGVQTNVVRQSLENLTTRIGAELLPAMSSLATELVKDPAFLNSMTVATGLLAHGLGYAVEVSGYLVTGFLSLGAGVVNLYGMFATGAQKIDEFTLGVLNALNKIPGVSSITQGAISALTADIEINKGKVADAQKTYDALVTVGGSVYDVTQSMGKGLLEVGSAATDKAAPGINAVGAATLAATEAQKKYAAALAEYNSVTGSTYLSIIKDIGNETYEGIKYDHDRGVSTETLAQIYGVTATQIGQVIKTEETWKKTQSEINKLIADAGQPLEEFSSKLQKLGTIVPQAYFENAGKVGLSLESIEQGVRGIGTEIQTVGTIAPTSLQSMYDALTMNEKIAYKLQGDFAALPNILISAFEGGGNVLGAVKAFGSKIGDSLLGAGGPLAGITAKVTSSVASMASGLGSTVASLAGTVVGGLATGGISLAIQGAVIGIKALVGIGKASQAELDARKSQDQLVTQLRTLATEAQKTQGAFTDAYHTIAIVARDAYIQTGESADQAEVHVAALLNTHNPQAYAAAMADLNAVLADQQQDAADLDTAIQKYGFSIAELGPTMQKQELTKQAVGLENDFRLLAGSGIDVNTVLEHMGGSINDFLHLAMQTGQEVPSEMEPMLQKMVDMGTLTDANGVQITDLGASGITFSETMTQGFQKVVDKLTLLIDTISATSGAINAIPTHKTVTVDVSYNDPGFNMGAPNVEGEGAATGGFVTSAGIQHFAGGGTVLPFTPRGTDTVPAMLTPGEEITSVPDRKTQAAAMQGLQDSQKMLMAQLATIQKILQNQPRAIGAAVSDAIVLAPRRRVG